ncbi:hypothetical protein FAM09_23050 [Niastella caeni]|uniref:Lipocalin-like domain-containing protein n=1 Tax=Niastella caeni TaxID=2569763 RepID=A0A4S8HM61_9BACT|nr:hypothetical protein [Niastella caeni]THU34874.1 hypothetical protein FAM09_23050 [Niastella caeni]
MKSFILIALFCTLVMYACSDKPEQKDSNTNSTADSPSVSKKIFIKGDPANYNDTLPNKRFKRSEIVSCSFKKEALFGTWTTSYENPACDFKIDEKEYFLCDYDGDGSRLYKIVKDTLFLDNPYLIFKGLILKATGDTLVIHWQENEEPEKLLRWKDNPDDQKSDTSESK